MTKKALVLLCSIMFVFAPALAQSFNYSNPGLDPIDVVGGAIVSRYLPDSIIITDLNVCIEMAYSEGPEGKWTYWDDFLIDIIHAGKTVSLNATPTGVIAGFFDVTFDDEAGSSLADARFTTDALGAIKPDGLLSDFDGENIFGWWDLSFTDISGFLDESRLVGWGISSHLTCDPIPEPSTMILLGSGLFGILAYCRKKFKK